MLDFNTLFLLVEYSTFQTPKLDIEKIRKFKWNEFDCMHSPTAHKNDQINTKRNDLDFDVNSLLMFASNAYEMMKPKFTKTGKYQCNLWIFDSKNLKRCLQIPYEFHVNIEKKKIESLELTMVYSYPTYNKSCVMHRLPPTDIYPMTNIPDLVNIPRNFTTRIMVNTGVGYYPGEDVSIVNFIKKTKFIPLQPCNFTDINTNFTREDLTVFNPDGLQMINVI